MCQYDGGYNRGAVKEKSVLGPADYMRLDGEDTRLRDVYRPGFFLMGIASNEDQRQGYLTQCGVQSQ